MDINLKRLLLLGLDPIITTLSKICLVLKVERRVLLGKLASCAYEEASRAYRVYENLQGIKDTVNCERCVVKCWEEVALAWVARMAQVDSRCMLRFWRYLGWIWVPKHEKASCQSYRKHQDEGRPLFFFV